MVFSLLKKLNQILDPVKNVIITHYNMATKKTLGSLKIDHNMVDHKANEMMKF